MSHALDQIVSEQPPLATATALWEEAIEAAGGVNRSRSAVGASARQRMVELRALIDQELVGFHEQLIVQPHEGNTKPTREDAALWDVHVPLTLFPRRGSGFHRVECILRFYADGKGGPTFHILQLFPAQRDYVLAKAEIGGTLQLSTSARVGAALPGAPEIASAMAALEAQARIEGTPVDITATRQCVETEIIGGTGARWRLDDLRSPRVLKVESHELRVVLETNAADSPLHAAGYLQAYSNTSWLTQVLGGQFWRDFRGGLRDFFGRGLPVESYAEWRDILKQ